MDAGMQAKELAGLLGVTPNTVINWELRGIRPMRKTVREKMQIFLSSNSV
jgi:DNA-binding transcriptional regulator YiaG